MHFIFLSASCLILFRHSLSIPFESDSESINLFDNTLPESDLQDYSNTLALNPADPFFPSSPPSLFSTNNNDGYDGIINDDNIDMFLSESQPDNNDNYCPLGKRQNADGNVCHSSDAPSPPLQINFPGLNDLSNIGKKQEEALPARRMTEGDNVCVIKPGYPWHACCDGPLGYLDVDEYFTVEGCDLGVYTPPLLLLLLCHMFSRRQSFEN